jgi:L,D-transpeptidase ErfK/SrfK
MKKILMTLFFLISVNANALVFKLPPVEDQVVGETEIISSEEGDTTYKIGRIYELGKDELLHANPQLPEQGRIQPGTAITIPARFILPNTPHVGITINLAEKRLYFYPKDTSEVITEPIAIGREGWDTPEIHTQIVQKIINPEWVAPNTIIEYSAEKGIDIPKVAMPGPNNPLGQFALRLGNWVVLIHGTNEPPAIGKRVSSGCIRMYPEDIALLFEKVEKNTPVYIINEPFKVGQQNNRLYLEVHQPMTEQHETSFSIKEKVYALIKKTTGDNNASVQWQTVNEIVRQQSGIPELINA